MILWPYYTPKTPHRHKSVFVIVHLWGIPSGDPRISPWESIPLGLLISNKHRPLAQCTSLACKSIVLAGFRRVAQQVT